MWRGRWWGKCCAHKPKNGCLFFSFQPPLPPWLRKGLVAIFFLSPSCPLMPPSVIQEVWQAQQQTEEAGLHKAKVEWQRLYCEQRQAFEEECNAFEKEMELTRKQVEDDKTAFEAGVRAQMEQEKEMLARRNEQLDQQQQEQQRRLEEQRAEQCARLQEDWAAHKDKVNEEQQGHRDAMAAERAQLAQELEAERKRALNDVAAQRKLHRQQLKGVAEQVSQTRERLWMAAEEQMACHALQMALAGEKWQADKARHAARVAAAQRRMEAEGREQCLMMRAEMEQLLALQRDEGRRQQLALTQSHEKALREAQQKRHVQETADLVAGEQQQRGGLEVHEGTHFVALVMAHVRDVTALQQREFAAAAQRNDEALAVARAQHRETRQELAKQIADQEAALRQTEARCAARERELEEEHERRQAALQSQEAREREVRHQQRVAEQVAAASALAKLKTEIAEQQKVRARETEAYEEERERRREQLESERQAQEREAAAREAAWESKRRVEEQRLRTLEADLQAADRRREERCQARADAQTRDTERQLRDGRAQAQLFADAFWEKGLAVGAEAGAWAQMQQLERDWHPLSGSKWARQKMDRLLSKEEGQRDRLLMWERDMRRDLLNLMRDDRRDVELAIRDRKARSVRRISALGRIRVKGEAADRAREAVPQRGNPPRLPPLQEVAALLDSAVVSDAAEMAAYKSYFSLQLQEVMKPSESLVL